MGLKKSDDSYQLAPSPWARFRCNSHASGRSVFPGPKGDKVVWEVKVGESSGEPAIGLDGTIYLPLKNFELVAINSNGKEFWRTSLIGHRKKPLRGITTPAIRVDGSLIVAALRKVVCLEPDGNVRWEKIIDGLPFSPNIGPQGRIYVSALSIDWAGMYVISPEGESVGKDDPSLTKEWHIARHVDVTPATIDKKSNVYVAYRANITHPEASSWADEVLEEFHYECVIFDPDGNKLRQFVPAQDKPCRYYPNAVSVNDNDLVHFIGGAYGDLYAFKLNSLLSLQIPNDIDWIDWADEEDPVQLQDFKEAIILKSQWMWDRYKDEKGRAGSIYMHEPLGYPALGEDSKLWIRLGQKNKSCGTEPCGPSHKILQIDSSEMQKRGLLHFHVLELSSPSETNPIIDGNGILYVGTQKGKVHVFASEKELRVIDVGSPVASLAIGLNQSLVVVTKDGAIKLIS